MGHPNQKDQFIPRLVIPEGATIEEIYAICRREFTAGDLQKYTENEPTVPMEQTIAEMERIHRAELDQPGSNSLNLA